MQYEIALGFHEGKQEYRVIRQAGQYDVLIDGGSPIFCMVYMATHGWDFKGKVNKMLVWQRPKVNEELPF